MNVSPIFTLKRKRILYIFSYFLFISLFCTAQDFEDKGYWSELMSYNHLPIDSLWLFHPGNDLPVMDSNNAGWEVANKSYYKTKMVSL
jgi:hypothetical protein